MHPGIDTMMKLYWYDTINPRKTVAEHLQLPVDYVYVDFAKCEHKTQAYLVPNPRGKMRALAGGKRVVWESSAIMYHPGRALVDAA